MKRIILLAALFVAIGANAQVTVWEDSFETYPDFEIATIGDWTQIDLDAGATYGSADFDFTNEQYVGTAIVFNPSEATPDPGGTQTTNADQVPEWQVRTGDKGLWMVASTTLLNDDYIISPPIALNGASGGTDFSFWAKSVTDNFGLERFEILLSTTGTAAADFTEDIGGGEQQAPVDVYTEYTADLTPYEGETVYIAIHYVAQDSFILQMDDFLVTTGVLGLEDIAFQGFNYAVNAQNELKLTGNNSFQNVAIYNVVGQQVLSKGLSSNNETVSLSALANGTYIATVTADDQKKSIKIVKN